MDDPIVETARGWLIEEKVGLISRSELIARVDDAIAGLPVAPRGLLEISLGESTAWSGRLDLVQCRVDDRDAARLARHLLAKLAASELDWDALEGVALAASRVIPRSESAQGQFMAIADGLHVARECGGISPREHEEARSRLQRIAAHAD